VTPEEAAGFYGDDEDPAEVFARFVAMTGGDLAGHDRRCRDSMRDAYARADARTAAWYQQQERGSAAGPLPAGAGAQPATVAKSGEEHAVSEASAVVVAVIDQTGRHHHFDADDWYVRDDGHVELTKDGKDAKPVATFAPGFLGVYKVAARAGAPVVQFDGGGGDAQ
jgi:hypothetical protein